MRCLLLRVVRRWRGHVGSPGVPLLSAAAPTPAISARPELLTVPAVCGPPSLGRPQPSPPCPGPALGARGTRLTPMRRAFPAPPTRPRAASGKGPAASQSSSSTSRPPPPAFAGPGVNPEPAAREPPVLNRVSPWCWGQIPGHWSDTLRGLQDTGVGGMTGAGGGVRAESKTRGVGVAETRALGMESCPPPARPGPAVPSSGTAGHRGQGCRPARPGPTRAPAALDAGREGRT